MNNSKLLYLCGGRYVAAGFSRFILYKFITLLNSQWQHRSRYCHLVVKLGTCPSRGH